MDRSPQVGKCTQRSRTDSRKHSVGCVCVCVKEASLTPSQLRWEYQVPRAAVSGAPAQRQPPVRSCLPCTGSDLTAALGTNFSLQVTALR